MILPGWVTVKPLLWAIAALLVLALGQFVLLQLAQADRDSAIAAQKVALGDLSTRTTERDAWKTRAGELEAGNLAWAESFAQLKHEFDAAQAERRRIESEGRQAIAVAQASAADADRTLKRFVDQFATESRRAPCAAALQQMEAACPALSGY